MRIFLFIFTFSSSVFATPKYDIMTFCQDLNIILQKVNTHTLNIANANTTRTEAGGPFRRLLIKNCKDGTCEIKKDQSSPIMKYNPDHPDTDENGYVAYPNFSVQEEMGFLIKAQSAYDLVIAAKPFKSTDLLVGNKFDQCFKDYKYFKEQFDFKTYLGR